MAAKKSSSKSKSRSKSKGNSKSSNNTYRIQLVGVILLCISILLGISVFAPSLMGAFSKYIRIGVVYLFGDIFSYVFCIYIFIVSIMLMISSLRQYFYRSRIYLWVMFALVLTLISSICFSEQFFVKTCESSWSTYIFGAPYRVITSNKHCGGIIGNLISSPMLAFMKKVGAIIVSSMLIFLDIILILKSKFFDGVEKVAGGIGSGVKKVGRGVSDFAGGVKEDMERERRQVEDGTYPTRERRRNSKKDLDEELKPPKWMKGKENKPKTFDLDNEDEAYDEENIVVADGLSFGKEIENNREKYKNDGFVRNILSGDKDESDDILIEDDIEGQINLSGEVIHINGNQSDDDSDDFAGSDAEDIDELHAEIEASKTSQRRRINYRLPSLSLLNPPEVKTSAASDATDVNREAVKLEQTLASFGVEAKVVNVTKGPAVTRYELHPGLGVKVSKITGLTDDIALSMAASGIRIEAPIPGKSAIGIEVPNKEVEPVLLREMLESPEFKNSKSDVTVGLGKSIGGEAVVADIAKMPHLLIAGTTGSGKSVCMNSMIASILYKSKPEDVRMLMIDPKHVELTVYNGIPHLLVPVVTDPKKASKALAEMVKEMDERYNLFTIKGVKNITGYNEMAKREGLEKMPYWIIIIDELADLMMVAHNEVEDRICRLAQLARAAGIHLVIATQSPRVDVITGLIKANMPSRIALSVASQMDSRVILDTGGAEKLLGNGDMLFHPQGKAKPMRVKGCFVSDGEVEKIVEYVKSQQSTSYNDVINENINSDDENNSSDGSGPDADSANKYDDLLNKAVDISIAAGKASSSLIQRKLSVGFARAARIIDQMEECGIVGPSEGSKPRELLIDADRWQEIKMAGIKKQNELNTSGDIIEPKNLYKPTEKFSGVNTTAFDMSGDEEDYDDFGGYNDQDSPEYPFDFDDADALDEPDSEL